MDLVRGSQEQLSWRPLTPLRVRLAPQKRPLEIAKCTFDECSTNGYIRPFLPGQMHNGVLSQLSVLNKDFKFYTI